MTRFMLFAYTAVKTCFTHWGKDVWFCWDGQRWTVSEDEPMPSAAEKVDTLKRWGFTQSREPHTWDCPGNYAGYRCNCIPGPAVWESPQDVLEYTHDTMEERRLAAQRRRQRQA